MFNKLITFFIIVPFIANSQYYTRTQIDAIHSTRVAKEGDLYLDTINNYYKIGLTNGKLGDVNNTSGNIIDSLGINNLILYIYSNSSKDSVDIYSLISNASIGEIKHSFKTTDHNGWYILDGRTNSSLPVNAQTNATSLGFATNIPDATNKVLKFPNIIENIADVGGTDSIQLTQNNLPNVSLLGNTSTDGNHTHDIVDMTHSVNRVIRGGQTRLRTYNYDPTGTVRTRNSGAHSHTVAINTGGNDIKFATYQPYIAINTFIYLGN